MGKPGVWMILHSEWESPHLQYSAGSVKKTQALPSLALPQDETQTRLFLLSIHVWRSSIVQSCPSPVICFINAGSCGH